MRPLLVLPALILAAGLGVAHAGTFDRERAAALQPQCGAGSAAACQELADLVEGDSSIPRESILPILVQGCGLSRADQSDEAIRLCIRAGEAFASNREAAKAHHYYQHACAAGFSKGCAFDDRLRQEEKWQAVLDQEAREFKEQNERELAEMDRQMFASVMQGLLQVASSAATASAARQRAVTPPSQAGIAVPSGAAVEAACAAVCQPQHSACTGGSVSGCYREAACNCRCFSAKAPGDPMRSEWDACAAKYDGLANQMASDAPPAFDFSKRPAPAPSAPPPPPPVQHSCPPGMSPCASGAR